MRSAPARRSFHPTLLACSLVLSCRPEPTTTPPPTDAAATDPDAVPDDAFAIVDGTVIPRLAFDEAMAKLSAGGPASRDDRGLRQRVGVALVARETIRMELARLGATDPAEAERRAAPLLAALTAASQPTAPTWWAMPPMTSDDLPGAIVVAADVAAPVTDEEVAAQFEKTKDRWTSEQPWFRVDTWTLSYDDAVGVEACDSYIAKYRRCVAKFPKATQPTVLADLTRQATQWRSRIDEPEWRTLLETECAATETEAMQQTHDMGCDWNSDASAAERKAVAGRRSELEKQARAAAERLGAGEDPLAVAASSGGVANVGNLVAADELPRAVAAAAKKLREGKVSKPIDDGHAWTVIRLVGRHPKGALTLDTVKPDVAQELRVVRIAESLEALPATLRGKHEVRLHESVESLDSGP